MSEAVTKGVTYPTHYSSLPRDAKVLLQFVNTLNAGLDPDAKNEVISRASLRLAKISGELDAIRKFLELKESEENA